MFKRVQQRLKSWMRRQRSYERDTVGLTRKHIYILPTGYGYWFTLMLGVMLLWAINYNNSMGFALTFLLAAVAFNAMWRSHRNLLGLRLQPGRAEPVFAGQQARFVYIMENSGPATRYGIGLQQAKADVCYRDIPARGHGIFILDIPAEQRGLLNPGPVRVFTRFPLGLFRAWSWLEFDQPCLVYPKPHGRQPLPVETGLAAGTEGGGSRAGSEDYAGLRSYIPGDAPRHIAWKATARSHRLLVKRFTDESRSELWLDWHRLTASSIEARLSQLCQWVLKAESAGYDYGLRLPVRQIPPGRGVSQRRRCLEALALFNLDNTDLP